LAQIAGTGAGILEELIVELCKPITTNRLDGILTVILLGRISKETQDLESIESQFAASERWLRAHYSGPIELIKLGEQISGLAERGTFLEALRLVELREVDLVLVTEAREIHRNPHHLWGFIQDCSDNDVRLISLGDRIDTLQDGWELNTNIATLRAGLTVPETRTRVRRKATHTFDKGGMVLKVKFGYRKLTKEEAASGQHGPIGLLIAKLPECTEIIKAKGKELVEGTSYAAVADQFNAEGVTPGPYVKSGKWTGRLVRELYQDPILSGFRTFRDTLTKCLKSGKRRSRRNPDGPETKECPELAHLTADEHRPILEEIARRGDSYRTDQNTGRNSLLWNRPRARTLWPGQHAACAICGGRMYRSGQHLRCCNSLPKSGSHCWNHVQVPYLQAREKIINFIVTVAEKHPAFRQQLLNAAWKEYQCRQQRLNVRATALDKEIAKQEKELANLVKFVRENGDLQFAAGAMRDAERQLLQRKQERATLDAQPETARFRSQDEVAGQLPRVLRELAETSFEFADCLRRMIPYFAIVPVQALHAPSVHPRAKLTLRLPKEKHADASCDIPAVIDLFDPPAHIKHLPACVSLHQAEPALTLKQIAGRLEIGHMTVKRALDYARRMAQAGIATPYRELTVAPKGASRWGKHTRRDFKPASLAG
jgi:DNA invertase Pin-like site-specific DNA recombinase